MGAGYSPPMIRWVTLRVRRKLNIGIYNRWLHTQGGAERYTGVAANVLAAQHDVTLITHQPVDLAAIGSRLNIDLSRVKLRCVEDLPDSISWLRLRRNMISSLTARTSRSCAKPGQAQHHVRLFSVPWDAYLGGAIAATGGPASLA